MTTTVAPTLQMPEGYTAIERIGSGGYGEVWRATAPGGVEKAVKLVYGHCSEDLAERELKSLERIRNVRHPFVISLERFEVVADRLVIVTELADRSLDDCYCNYREAGLPGVPREELLRYMSDAADALDCLVDHHSLQHLDIKPENILLVGDHVKLGDFGLVKELATRTLNSMMGGMTPLYSAPEVFDDNPSPRSDQYSLAIVYQQMLTGQLPFAGRTPAQLAKQHTQAEPNLQPLDEGDRQVLRRALAKRPEARFGSCREFVAALAAGGIAAANGKAASMVHGGSQVAVDSPDDTKSIAASSTQTSGNTPAAHWAESPSQGPGQPQQAARPAPVQLEYPAVSGEITDLEPPSVDLSDCATVPTLLVAVGGLGAQLATDARSRIATSNQDAKAFEYLTWLAIDTDRDALNTAATEHGVGRLRTDDLLHIPLKRPKQYRDGSQAMLRWVSRRWLYNIPRSLETRGYRPLGRIAAVDHAEAILGALYVRLHHLKQSHSDAKRLRVVLLSGTTGGTGSGTLIDIAQAARSLAGDLSVEIQVDALLAMPESSAGTADSLAMANTYSLLTELAHAQRAGNAGASAPTGPAARYESQTAPLDAVYLLPIPPRTLGEQRLHAFNSIAEYLALECISPATAAVLTACRHATTTDDLRLRSFRCVELGDELPTGELLERTKLAVLECGCQRMSLLIGGTVPSCVQQVRPLIAKYDAPLDSPTMVTEAAGIDPLDVAARLAEFYPDIAEAADRLRTRDDIDWCDLRSKAGQ